MKRIGLLILLLFSSALLLAQHTEHVVIVVIDGVRYSETFGDPAHRYIPKIWSLLRPQGVVYTAYYNNGRAETCPGHSSIVTGSWQHIRNDGSERPHVPTVFEYYRKEKQSALDENFVILGKTKLHILASSDAEQYGASYGAGVEYSPDPPSNFAAWENFKTVMSSYRPRIAILNMPATDGAAHAGDWDGYLRALCITDSLVYEMWSLIQADSVLRGKTTLFVTNDHGRHLDSVSTGFHDHGDGCEGCRHIMLLALGPDTPQGIIDSTACQQIDIAPTVGDLLGFSTPQATGHALRSAILLREKGSSLKVPGAAIPSPQNKESP